MCIQGSLYRWACIQVKKITEKYGFGDLYRPAVVSPWSDRLLELFADEG